MNIWQAKLLAFLHDPPHKAQDVAGHESDRARISDPPGMLVCGLV